MVLGDATGSMLRVRSDVERKGLFGLGANANSSSPLDGGIYRPRVCGNTEIVGASQLFRYFRFSAGQESFRLCV
jgi:hypothetical protein